MNDLMLTLSAILVRAEFCKKVQEAGGLELIQDVMTKFLDNEVFLLTFCLPCFIMFFFLIETHPTMLQINQGVSRK